MMASCDVYTVDELVGKRNAVLKSILREAGKPSSGTKAQLVQRILSFQIRKSATTQAAIGEKLESIRLAENQLSQLKSELTRLESSVHVHNQTGGDNFMPDPTHESSPKPDIFQATHQENPDIDYHYYYHTRSECEFLSQPPTPEHKQVPTPAPRPTKARSVFTDHHESRRTVQHDMIIADSHNDLAHSVQLRPTPKPRVHVNDPRSLFHDGYHNSQPAQNNRPAALPATASNTYSVQPDSSNPLPYNNGSSDQATALTHRLLEKISDNINDVHYPVVEPEMFDGDIMVYQEWRKQFLNYIGRKKNMSSEDKLYYLQKFTKGEAYQAVRGYCILKSEQAFKDAIESLDSDYGSCFLAAHAFKSKLRSWPKVPQNDPKALKRLTNFLKQCRAAMIDIPDLEKLDDCEENQKILCLLPDNIVNKWNDRVTDYMAANDEQYPDFHMFVDFLIKQTKSANNPISSLSAVRQATSNPQAGHSKQENPKPAPRTKSENAVTNNSINKENSGKTECIICHSADHRYVAQCKTFKAMNHDSRLKTIRDKNLCFRCMGRNHSAKKCEKTWKCRSCGSTRHHTLLHEADKKAQAKGEETTPQTACTNTQIDVSTCKLYTKILPVWLSTEINPDQEFLTYALLDEQSNTTFVTNDLAAKLTAKSEVAPLKISTMTSQNCAVATRKYFGLRIRGFYCGNYVSMPSTYSRQHIPYIQSSIPISEDIEKLDHLKSISHLVAPKLNCGVDLLIGRNCVATTHYQKLIEAPQDSTACAVKTPIGWCIVGPDGSSTAAIHDDFVDEIGVSHALLCQPIDTCNQVLDTNDPILSQHQITVALQTDVQELSPHDLMKLVCDADFLSDNDSKLMSQEDIKFLEILDSQTYQDSEKYYTMPLPFKTNFAQLSNNYKAALTRFEYLQSRFQRDPEYAKQYSEFIQGIINRGEAERVPNSELKKGECWYLPHHGVFHKQNNKFRVVFDCSARYQGVSLNDTLLQGPDLNNPLIGVLLRFRKHQVAVSCDIEKMYHRFRVTPAHRDYLRFIWLENGKPVVYRMLVHIFGARSSPNCAKYGLNKLAADYGNQSSAQKFISSNFYVDDGLCSVNSVSEAIDLLNQTRDVCSRGNLRVHKLLSNKSEVLQVFPPSDCAVDVGNVTLCSSTERALGVLWSLKSDSFTYNYNTSNEPCTRRTMLSDIASLYDPMGLISPLILSGRIILQNACKSGYTWDEILKDDYAENWLNWNQNMSKLSNLEIQRAVNPPDFSSVRQEIHTFADASTSGFGACSYLRSIDKQNNAHCSLIFGKSRVAPIKVTTIPRLELQAALLAAKQTAMLSEELQLDAECYLWSDSKIVLGYINNDEKRFYTYVSNRLAQIHDISNKSQWHYVNTKQNPADLASRGVNSVESLSQSMWLSGPDFLWNSALPEKLSVSGVEQFEVDQNDPELKKEVHVVVSHDTCVDTQAEYLLDLCSRFSSWFKAVHTLALVQKVIQNRHDILSKQAVNVYHSVTVDDIQVMSNRIVCAAQACSFSTEIECLRSGKTIPKTSSLYKLDCFLDSEGAIRVGGRIKHAKVTGVENHPFIMPKSSHISEIIVRHYHNACGHQGRTTTMGAVRSAGFWIVGLHGIVSSQIQKCTKCRRLRRPTENQKMADLPADRVEVAAPFTYTGCDVFGPYTVKDRRTSIKRYGLIFTCLSSRAVHIEMLDDLSTDSFINSLRCFISLRGNVRILRCDNGTNFVGANNELRRHHQNMVCDPKIKEYLLQHQCDFQFNPPESSHFGGTWERMIRSARNVLSGLSGQINERLDSSSLRTLFYECMAIINSRPLTTVENDVQPLSPNDLLHMKSNVVLPIPGSFDSDDVYSRKRWIKVQALTNVFWKRWSKEYLTTLQTRQKWQSKTCNLKLNDIVILSDQCSRLDWPLGRVVKVVPSKDSLVRHVHVLTFDKVSNRHVTLVRPVTKLVLLLES